MKFKVLTGYELPTMKFTAGSAIAVGDLVALANDDSKLDTVAADGVQALGWAMEPAAADGDVITVALGFEFVMAEMPVTGSYSAGMIGKYYALVGGTGAQEIDISDTGHDLLRLCTYDAATDTGYAQIIPSAFQFGAKEVS